jgi:hypothetical protein
MTPQAPKENQDAKSSPWAVDIPWWNDSFRKQESETINRVIEMTLRNLERFKEKGRP